MLWQPCPYSSFRDQGVCRSTRGGPDVRSWDVDVNVAGDGPAAARDKPRSSSGILRDGMVIGYPVDWRQFRSALPWPTRALAAASMVHRSVLPVPAGRFGVGVGDQPLWRLSHGISGGSACAQGIRL